MPAALRWHSEALELARAGVSVSEQEAMDPQDRRALLLLSRAWSRAESDANNEALAGLGR